MVANPLEVLLQAMHARLASLNDGAVATYIPELGRADPARFGIAIATADGHLYSLGDARLPFTIQSISKPFVYGLSLDDRGFNAILDRIGVEPSGEAFNAISLEHGTGRPLNPMINAGAIAVASMIRGRDSAERWDRVQAMLSAHAGRPLEVDDSVFRSEFETGHRNRAIGHLLRNAEIFDEDVDTVCNRYFMQCSVSITCEDLAMMAATLANGGVNPRTSLRAIQPDNVERVLSVMTTCGMYDGAGSWVYRVGMPAKSGVSGGVMAVLPGQLGLAVYSPLLDGAGNSVRGVAVCEELSREFGLHFLRPPVSPRSVIRATLRLSDSPSKRRRTPAEAAMLELAAREVYVVQLQGPVVFSTAESAIRETLGVARPAGLTVFDLKRTTAIDPSVWRLFGLLGREVASYGGSLVFAPLAPEDPGAGLVAEALGQAGEGAIRFFSDVDRALEWCEDRVLGQDGVPPGSQPELRLENHPLLAGLSPPQLSALAGIAVRQVFDRGQRIIARDERGDAVYLLVCGGVQVAVRSHGGQVHKVATQSAGTCFGELALLDHGTRSADVDALVPSVCYSIPMEALPDADAKAPGLYLHLVQALARDLADRLRRANREIEALAT